MNLEQFLEKRLTKEEGKKDNKLIKITLPDELVELINSNDRGNKILTDNVIRFIRELKRDLEA